MKDNAQENMSTYKQAGVDIDAAAELVERIKPHVQKTKRPGMVSGIGGFGALFDLKEAKFKDPVLVSSTDGVGTKIKVAIDLNRHETIGIDAVAMCVNDIVVQGAEPLFFLDYFATGKLVPNTAEDVIAGIAEGCQQAGCALIGGETAEMPGFYAPGEYDIAGFSVGAAERNALITGETIEEGDVILGLSSNGLHSNGFSLVRHVIANSEKYNYASTLSFEENLSLGELILMPTRIYVRSILKALEHKDRKGKPLIKGMAHITGGGLYENIPRVLPDDLSAELDAASWKMPPLFGWLAEVGNISEEEMARTLNCGIGFVVICKPDGVSAIKKTLIKEGETVYEIGEIKKQNVANIKLTIKNLEDLCG